MRKILYMFAFTFMFLFFGSINVYADETQPLEQSETQQEQATTPEEAEEEQPLYAPQDVFTANEVSEEDKETLRNNKGEYDEAVNVNTGIYYQKLKDALDNALQGHTVMVLKDLLYNNASEYFTLNGITLDLDGHTITDDIALDGVLPYILIYLEMDQPSQMVHLQ